LATAGLTVGIVVGVLTVIGTSEDDTGTVPPEGTVMTEDQFIYPLSRISTVWFPAGAALRVTGVVPWYSLSR
jgi:hypothetical protein